MASSRIKCTVIEKKLLSPTVFSVRFKPSRKFNYDPGQFISVEVPHKDGKSKPLRRVYSLSGGPEISKKNGYELCIKLVPNGRGTNFLAQLRPGDTFMAHAPFGHFGYKTPKRERSLCFVATGSGIAPFRSIIQSNEFKKNKPQEVFLLFGARTENEILFKEEFEKAGVKVIACLTEPSKFWRGPKGRVTQYLKTATDIPWHLTDFYLCGNGEMLQDVQRLLKGYFGIADSSITKEAFALTPYNAKPAAKKKAYFGLEKRKRDIPDTIQEKLAIGSNG